MATHLPPPPAIVVHLVARLNQFFSKCFPRGIPSIFHFIRHQQVSLESRQLLCANDLIQQRTSPFVVVELCQEADDGEACQGGDYRILIPVESENAKKLFFFKSVSSKLSYSHFTDFFIATEEPFGQEYLSN